MGGAVPDLDDDILHRRPTYALARHLDGLTTAIHCQELGSAPTLEQVGNTVEDSRKARSKHAANKRRQERRDRFGRGDIALRVPPGMWSEAEELLGEPFD